MVWYWQEGKNLRKILFLHYWGAKPDDLASDSAWEASHVGQSQMLTPLGGCSCQQQAHPRHPWSRAYDLGPQPRQPVLGGVCLWKSSAGKDVGEISEKGAQWPSMQIAVSASFTVSMIDSIIHLLLLAFWTFIFKQTKKTLSFPMDKFFSPMLAFLWLGT